jgi:hypothetical protein
MRHLVVPAALLALAACAPGADGPGGVPTLEAAAARLPASAADFTRGDTVWHERDRPGLGVQVDYAVLPGRAAVATVSIYDRSGGAIRAGDARLAQEFSTMVAEVVALPGTRTSLQIAERERSELPVPGGQPMSCSRLEGTYGRQEVRTLVCLGVAAGRFLKVQVTAPARPVRPVDPAAFVVSITQAARGVS